MQCFTEYSPVPPGWRVYQECNLFGKNCRAGVVRRPVVGPQQNDECEP
jgi:hypothetical protein